MGAIAAEFSDLVIVTSDNPRNRETGWHYSGYPCRNVSVTDTAYRGEKSY